MQRTQPAKVWYTHVKLHCRRFDDQPLTRKAAEAVVLSSALVGVGKDLAGAGWDRLGWLARMH